EGARVIPLFSVGRHAASQGAYRVAWALLRAREALELAAQRGAPSSEPAAHGIGRNSEHLRYLRTVEPFPVGELESDPKVDRYGRKRAKQQRLPLVSRRPLAG